MIFKQNLEQIENYPEYKLFFLIDECNYYITVLNESVRSNKELSNEEKDVMLENVAKVRNIRKSTCDVIKKNLGFECYEKNTPTDKYIDWWNDWNDWRMSFSEKEWDKIEEKIISDEDIKEYLPK